MDATIEVRPLEGLGAEVDMDLRRALTREDQERLVDLLRRYRLLVLRQPELSFDDQTRFARCFGRLLPVGLDDRFEQYVSNTRPDGTLGSDELPWHSDISFAPEPYRVLGLYAVDVVAGASCTRFVDAALAWPTLPATLRERVRYRQVVHIGPMGQAGPRGQRLRRLGSSAIAAVHPIVLEHPLDATPVLYVNEFASDCVLGMEPAESAELLQALFAHLYQPENVHEHWWRNGDFVIWDNLALQHARGNVADVGPRTLRKVTVGPATFAEQFPGLFASVVGDYVASSR